MRKQQRQILPHLSEILNLGAQFGQQGIPDAKETQPPAGRPCCPMGVSWNQESRIKSL
jgi:hypothetical protein